MWTTQKLLSEVQSHVKIKRHSDSYYRVAKELEVSDNTVRNWARGASMDDENAIKIAVLLNLDVEYVLACLHAERAHGKPSYEFLCRIADRVKPKMAA